MCVAYNTLGCTGDMKNTIEKTFIQVRSVVDHMCTPPAEPETSTQCDALPGEQSTQGCDVTGAVECMYHVYSELLCDRPDYKTICP